MLCYAVYLVYLLGHIYTIREEEQKKSLILFYVILFSNRECYVAKDGTKVDLGV
jgi:hypothetical protein